MKDCMQPICHSFETLNYYVFIKLDVLNSFTLFNAFVMNSVHCYVPIYSFLFVCKAFHSLKEWQTRFNQCLLFVLSVLKPCQSKTYCVMQPNYLQLSLHFLCLLCDQMFLVALHVYCEWKAMQ